MASECDLLPFQFIDQTIIKFLNPTFILIMNPNMKNKPCKFKQTCKNFIAGRECPFSHDPSNAFSQASFSVNRRQFSQPKNEVECKFGAKCNKLAEGKCPFKHSPQGMSNQPSMQPKKKFDLPKHETPCQYGARCNMFPLGKCPFKHEQSTMPAVQANNSLSERPKDDTTQTFKNVFSGLCFDFLMNRAENQECGKMHQFTTSKNIKKIFQVDNQKIVKCSIFQYYQQDEQPIYVILAQGKIVFGQLLNLAKESGMEHINNSAMVFKRCFDKDVAFHGEMIEDFYLTHSLSQDYPRVDILVIKGSKNIHICLINNGNMQSFPNNKNIVSSIFIKTHLLISFQDKTKWFLKFNPSNLSFQQEQCPFAQDLYNFRGYFKKLFGSEIVGSISEDKTVCFLNEKLEVHPIEMEQKVKDLFILEHEGSPFAFILTETALFAINLLTFQKKCILESGISQDLLFSSMAYTLGHIFLSIDSWGILIYNICTFQSPAGLLCLGDRQWTLSADDRGNLSVVSREKDGYSSWWVFKVRRH